MLRYSVTCDGVEIYNTATPTQDTQLISPILERSENAAGSFEFTMLPNNPFYNSLKRMKSVIRIFENDEWIWEGRILNEDDDFYNQRNVYCEGDLAYLNDTRQPQREYTGYDDSTGLRRYIETLLNVHNSKVSDEKAFYIGYVTVDAVLPQVFFTQFDSTLNCLNNLVDKYGGYLVIRRVDGKRYLDYIPEYNIISNQTIRFGENLLDFTRSYDMSNLVTVLLPLGNKSTDRNTSIGDEIIFNESGSAWPAIRYGEAFYFDDDEEKVKLTYTYPGTEEPLNDYFASAWLYVSEGETYYLTTRLPKGYNFVTYALLLPNDELYSYEEVGSGVGYQDETQIKIEIPAGVTSMWISGYTEYVKITVNEGREIPDELEDYTTVESVNGGSLYVKALPRDITYYDERGNAITKTIDPMEEFGYLEKTIEFDEVDDPQTLLDMANQYLTDYQFDGMTLEVNAVDLRLLGIDVESIDIYQMIRVTSPVHGLDRLFPITKVKIDLSNHSNDTYTIGDSNDTSLTSTNNAIDSEIFNAISSIPSVDYILQSAQANAFQLITSSVGGFVTLIKNATGTAVEAIAITQEAISGREDLVGKGNYWLWNKDGLGYVNSSGVRTSVALTSDGKIVADYITSGTMQADRIKGGTLNLGNYGNTQAVLQVQDGTFDSNNYPRCVLYADKDYVEFRSKNDSLNRGIRMWNGMLTGYSGNRESVDFSNQTDYENYARSTIGLAAEFVDQSPNYGMFIRTTGLISLISYGGIWTQTQNESGHSYTGTVRVMDSNGDPLTLRFINGILCDDNL